MPITGNQDDYGRAIQSRVVGDKDGKISTLRRYTRIISANHPDKLKDIRKYLSDFLGANFTLYVTKRSNSFELVIIDSNEIFVHFYGAGQVINSTLHIVGKAVTAHFLSIYERLHSPKDDPDLLRIDFKHLKPSDVEDEDKKLQELFANSGSHPY
jgi:hypothetical protein